MPSVSVCLLLLAIAAVTAGLVRKVHVPLPLLQIAAGALLAWPFGVRVDLEPEVFLLVFIPPLLFIDGWRIPKGDFRRFRRTILMLAFGLVVFTVLVIGALVEWCIPAIPPFVAFALASALSPTDAVAVAGISGRTKVPSKLMHVLQGEALMNDASGLVCLNVAIAAIATGHFSWTRAAGSLVVVAAGGLAIGFVVAFVFSRLQRLVFGNRDDLPEGRILFVLVLPYAAYLVGEHVHVSGIMAAATAGMVLPRLGLFDVGERVARTQTITVLHALELALNGLVFVLLGLQIPDMVERMPSVVVHGKLGSWSALAETILVTAFGLFAVRFAWVWVSMRLTLRRRGPVPLRLVLATAFAGARGAVSLAATAMLPLIVTTDEGDYPAREVGICIAIAVILISLLAASIGLPFALRGVALEEEDADDRATLRETLVEAAIAAVERARDSADDEEVTAAAAALVLDTYRARITADSEDDARRERVIRELRLIGIAAERQKLDELFRSRAIEDVTYRDTLGDLDVLEEALTKSSTRHH